ncbi:hypothetical protein H632_c2022p1 [Helicosporidium sp. ATCC 50920]|nr:hypothetical protein H632_c2022p1 [Helicosporidium sp. ATCC 50920]|eukprot:KDD73597.1 hypothetical protein H632_c2022p1 [Helicosporidium sp. ATCC 50920]
MYSQKRKRTTPEPTLPEVDANTVLWGVDPGKINLFTAVINREGKLSYKTNRFYNDAYYTQCKKRHQKHLRQEP